MKIECSLFHDLAPMYIEELVSEDSKQFIEHHKTHCQECYLSYKRLRNESAHNAPLHKVEALPYWSKKRRKVYYGISLMFLLCVIGIFVGKCILSSQWYQISTGNLVELEEFYDGKDRFAQEKAALLDFAKQCNISKDAKILMEGVIEGVTFQVKEDGEAINPIDEVHIIRVYDQGKSYKIQFNGRYTVFIDECEENELVREKQYYNFYEYIEFLDAYDSGIVNGLGYPYYHVNYSFYEVLEAEVSLEGCVLYLYQNGKYELVEQIPEGDYAYYAYVGSVEPNTFSREDGTYGYLFIKRS